MPHSIQVSLEVAVDGRASASVSRPFAVEVVDSVDRTVQAGSGKVQLEDVLPGDVGDVGVVAVTASSYSSDLKFRFHANLGGDPMTLDEPLLLLGSQAEDLLDPSNQTMAVKNDTGADVRIRVLVGRAA